jgi:hypothetical protein
MTAIRVFDPAMCCSTGVCGPAVDPQLARFAADLDWLKAQGVTVERFNLAQQPAAFAEDDAVCSVLHAKGRAGLPVVKVNGEVMSSGVYPSRDELATWAGVSAPAARATSPIMLKSVSSSCCAPATGQATDEQPAIKSGCC